MREFDPVNKASVIEIGGEGGITRALESPLLKSQDIRQLINRVERVSGIPLCIQPDATEAFTALNNAQVHFSNSENPYHLIVYDPGSKILDHLIAHECAHILRWEASPQSDRVLPIITEETLQYPVQDLRTDRAIEIAAAMIEQSSPEEIYKLMRQYAAETVAALMNIPIDIQLEKWLHREYPGLRRVQIDGVSENINRRLLGTSPFVEVTTPQCVFLAFNAMNFVYTIELGILTGEEVTADAYEEREIMKLGRQLHRILKSRDPSHQGEDREVIDLWADTLGIRRWYQWIDPNKMIGKATLF